MSCGTASLWIADVFQGLPHPFPIVCSAFSQLLPGETTAFGMIPFASTPCPHTPGRGRHIGVQAAFAAL